MKVREWKKEDIPQISELYFNTVHNINSKDYSDKHVAVWASEIMPDDFWLKRFDNYLVNVVIEDEQVLGFAEYQYPGHVDCFYVHHEWQRKGVGTLLLTKIEKNAKKEKTKRLFADVSVSAKPFFLEKGFNIVKQQNKHYKELTFEQYFMEKWL